MGADEVNLATLRGSWMICWGRGVARLAGWAAQGSDHMHLRLTYCIWGPTDHYTTDCRTTEYLSLIHI